jgi:hypothetical protein
MAYDNIQEVVVAEAHNQPPPPSPVSGGKCGCSRERSLDSVREDRLVGPSGKAWSIRLGGNGEGTAGRRVYSLL